MLKSEQIQAEIDRKLTERAEEAAKGQQTNHEHVIQLQNEIDILSMQLSDAKAQESQQQDAQVQQQAQAAQIGGLKETLRSIFEAAFPKDETVKVIGLTEYESTQQTFNQLIDQAVDEDQTALYAAFNTQLEQRDEKFRALTSQALDVQNALDKANGTIQAQTETIAEHEKTIEQLKFDAAIDEGSLNQKDAEISRLEKLLEDEKSHTFDLQKALNDAPAPKPAIDITPTAPSESLSDKIAAAKVASVTKFSNLYSDVTYTDGTKQVVHNSMLTALEIPVLPTLEPVASQNVEQSAHTEQVIHPSEVQTGNTEGNPTVEGNTAIPESLGESAKPAEFLTLESLKAELDAIKSEHGARLDNIERHANLPAVA